MSQHQPYDTRSDEITLQAQYAMVDATHQAIRVNDMMAICLTDGVVYVTRQQAMDFFNLQPKD